MLLWLNNFPAKKGIKENPPREIITVREVDFNKHRKAVFGSYVESRTVVTAKNSMKTLTYTYIALIPSGNLQGYQNMFQIYTGIVFECSIIKYFTMSDGVVIHMNDWGRKSNSKEYLKKTQFLNITKEKYYWDNDELEEAEGLV